MTTLELLSETLTKIKKHPVLDVALTENERIYQRVLTDPRIHGLVSKATDGKTLVEIIKIVSCLSCDIFGIYPIPSYTKHKDWFFVVAASDIARTALKAIDVYENESNFNQYFRTYFEWWSISCRTAFLNDLLVSELNSRISQHGEFANRIYELLFFKEAHRDPAARKLVHTLVGDLASKYLFVISKKGASIYPPGMMESEKEEAKSQKKPSKKHEASAGYHLAIVLDDFFSLAGEERAAEILDRYVPKKFSRIATKGRLLKELEKETSSPIERLKKRYFSEEHSLSSIIGDFSEGQKTKIRLITRNQNVAPLLEYRARHPEETLKKIAEETGKSQKTMYRAWATYKEHRRELAPVFEESFEFIDESANWYKSINDCCFRDQIADDGDEDNPYELSGPEDPLDGNSSAPEE